MKNLVWLFCLSFATAASAQEIFVISPPPCGDKVAVTAFTLTPAAPAPYEAVKVFMTISNPCSYSMNVPWEIRRNYSSSFYYPVGSGTVAIAAASAVTVSAIWIATPGSHSFSGFADPTNTLSDANLTNNTTNPVAVTVAPFDAVAVTAFSVTPSAPRVGDPITLSMSIRNQCSWAELNVPWRITRDGVTWATGSVLIGPGLTVTVRSAWTPMTPVTSSVSGIADPDNVLVDSNFTNNRASTVNVTVAPMDSVAVVAFSVSPLTPNAYDAVTASMAIRNQTASARNVPWTLTQDGVSIKSGTSAIPAGATVTVSGQSPVKAGSVRFSGQADPANTSYDTNLANNVPASPVDLNVLPVDTVAVTGFAVTPLSPKANDVVSVTMSIRNLVAVPLNVPWNLTRNGTAIGSGTTAIPAGGTVNVTGQWVAIAGTSHLSGRADPANTLSDSNQANNVPVQVDLSVAPIIVSQLLDVFAAAKVGGGFYAQNAGTCAAVDIRNVCLSGDACNVAGAVSPPAAASTPFSVLFHFQAPVGSSCAADPYAFGKFSLRNGWVVSAVDLFKWQGPYCDAQWESQPPAIGGKAPFVQIRWGGNSAAHCDAAVNIRIAGPQAPSGINPAYWPYACVSGYDCNTGLPVDVVN